jgi:penicillin-binding protein 1A
MRAAFLALAALVLGPVAAPLSAEEPAAFWSLKPEHLRVLVASSQVMATRTQTGWEAYCRCPVILKPHEIPEAFKRAVIAIEDRRFEEHGGIDWLSLPRIVTSGFRQGASTIPMQLAKNLLFHDLRGADGKTERKLLEFQAAAALDGALTKDELFAAYANQVEFGGREIVGLYRAARHYFRKEPRDLTAFEAALLAGMLKAPATYNPADGAKKEKAYARARRILDVMVEQGLWTESERRRAEETGVRPGLMPEFKIQSQAFTEWIVQTWGAQFAEAGETIRLFVTYEPRYQRIAESQLADLASEGSVPPEYEAAAVIMSPDGQVRAMVGSTDWTRNQFNNAVKARVQPGSTAKLALLVAACEKGRAPNSRVVDLPVSGEWPSNGALGHKGATTLKDTIVWSRNAGAVRLARDLGVETVADASRRLGVDPGPKPTMGLVLGPFTTNPAAMTAAYAAVANGGYRAAPRGVLAAVDGRGRIRGAFLNVSKTRVVAQRCIGPVQSVLGEVVRAGTGRGAALRPWKAFGKTGTTTDNADAWFIGWSEGRVMGVWMGRRRTAEGVALAGKDAPADLFRRVIGRINAMEDYRQDREATTSVVARAPSGSKAKASTPRAASPHAKSRDAGSRAASSPARPMLPPPRPRNGKVAATS